MGRLMVLAAGVAAAFFFLKDDTAPVDLPPGDPAAPPVPGPRKRKRKKK